MYFTGDDGYQFFLVLAPMLSSLTLDSNKNVTNWVSTDYHLKKLNHLTLTLNSPCLI